MAGQIYIYGVLGGITLLSLYAGLIDFQTFRIPNWISVTFIALFGIVLLVHVLAGKNIASWFMHLGASALLAMPLIWLFATGRMGGGDVKFMTTLSLFAGPSLIFPFVLVITVTGGLLAFMSWSFLKVRGTHNENSQALSAPIPYGIAIAMGGLFLTTSPSVSNFIGI